MRILAILWALMTAPVAWAAPLDVRTGDHQGYTRVVVKITDGTDWRVGRVEGGYGIQIDSAQGFDTADFYDRISADRITGLGDGDDPTRLVLELGCDCSADAFVFASNYLVVDIRDGPATTESAFEELLDPLEVASPGPVPPKTPMLSEAVTTPPSVAFAQIQDLENTVLQGLSRAASQGLLTPARDLPPTAAKEAPAQDELVQFLEGALAGLEAHTSVDLPTLGTQQVTNARGQACLDDGLFSIADWADDRPFHVQISELRRAVIHDFESVDEAAVLSLARAYLHFGFGYEAISALEILPAQSRERQVMRAMAALMDDFTQPNQVLDGQVSCVGHAAFWSFLSDDIGGYDQPPAIEAIMRGFMSMPEPLQRLLGPRLAQRFTYLGETALAAQALQTSQARDRQEPQTVIVSAELAARMTDASRAEEILIGYTDQGGRMMPEILLDYFQANAQTGRPPNPDALAHADIMRFEYRNQPILPQIVIAQILALLRADAPERAVAVFDQEHEGLTPDEVAGVKTAIMTSYLEKGSDPAFLEQAFGPMALGIEANVQNQVAGRLLALGFPDRASVLVATGVRGTDMAERRYLRAQAQLDAGKAGEALVTLSGLTTDRAAILRKQAELSLQENLAASTYGASDAISRAWRDGDWGTLAVGPDDVLRQVSNAVLAEVEQPQPTAPPTLADGRNILAQSVQARALLDQVLTRFEPVSGE